jgi:hypothetical protein
MAPQPIHLIDLRLHSDWLQHLNWPQHWTWHAILRVFDPLHILVPLFGAAVIAIRKSGQGLRERRSANWPVTDATVLTTRIKAQNGYWVEVDYRFFACDQYRYGTFRRHYRLKPQAESFAAAVRALQVPVHYQAEAPDVSVLVESELRFIVQSAGSLEPRQL